MDVYLFQGARSRNCNAAFSSFDAAARWIREHGLTGMLLRYTIDRPSYEEHLASGTLPRLFREPTPEAREQYIDGDDSWHFCLGLEESEEGFLDAFKRWHARFEEPR